MILKTAIKSRMIIFRNSHEIILKTVLKMFLQRELMRMILKNDINSLTELSKIDIKMTF